MKVPRIYIDTSVIGGCFDPEFAPWSNGLMEDFSHGEFKPVISEVVAAEVRSAPRPIREKYAELLDLRPEILPVSDEALNLLRAYQGTDSGHKVQKRHAAHRSCNSGSSRYPGKLELQAYSPL